METFSPQQNKLHEGNVEWCLVPPRTTWTSYFWTNASSDAHSVLCPVWRKLFCISWWWCDHIARTKRNVQRARCGTFETFVTNWTSSWKRLGHAESRCCVVIQRVAWCSNPSQWGIEPFFVSASQSNLREQSALQLACSSASMRPLYIHWRLAIITWVEIHQSLVQLALVGIRLNKLVSPALWPSSVSGMAKALKSQESRKQAGKQARTRTFRCIFSQNIRVDEIFLVALHNNRWQKHHAFWTGSCEVAVKMQALVPTFVR